MDQCIGTTDVYPCSKDVAQPKSTTTSCAATSTEIKIKTITLDDTQKDEDQPPQEERKIISCSSTESLSESSSEAPTVICRETNVVSNRNQTNFVHVHLKPPVFSEPVDSLIEFRFDVLNSIAILQNEPSCTERTIFNPCMGNVFTVIETVIHYQTQSLYVFLNGQWVLTSLSIPIAQHICFSMDNGTKRYEEVIKLDSTRYLCSPEIQGQSATFHSVDYRVKRGDPTRRPKFRDILKKSLQQILGTFHASPMELFISRASGRALLMDKSISNFFSKSKEPFEIHVQPLLQHVLQHIKFKLSGANYTLAGHFYRPVLSHASIHICSGETQLFESALLNIAHFERRVYATVHDSSLAKKIIDKDSVLGLTIVNSISYLDFGSGNWGPHVLTQNPRVPTACNPLINLHMNPTFNEDFNMYASPIFIPPLGFPFQTNPRVGCYSEEQYVQIAPFPRTIIEAPPQHDHYGSNSEDDSATALKLNAMAAEFYPLGYMSDTTNIHSNVSVLLVNPTFVGPEHVTVSALISDSEDFFEIEHHHKSKPCCSSETQTCSHNDVGHANGSAGSSYAKRKERSGRNPNETFGNSWSEEVEDHYEEYNEYTLAGGGDGYSKPRRPDFEGRKGSDWSRPFNFDREQRGHPPPWRHNRGPGRGSYNPRWEHNTNTDYEVFNEGSYEMEPPKGYSRSTTNFHQPARFPRGRARGNFRGNSNRFNSPREEKSKQAAKPNETSQPDNNNIPTVSTNTNPGTSGT